MTLRPLTIFVKELHRRSSTGFLIRLWNCLVMLFGMLIGWFQKPRLSGLVDLSYVFYMLRKNKLAKMYNTERYIRTFRHIYYKWSILVMRYKSTLNLDLLYRIYNCIWICEYILLSSLYIYIYIYIYIYSIYIYMNLVFFAYCNIVATYTYDGHTGFTFIWSFPAGFTSRHGLHNCEHDLSC